MEQGASDGLLYKQLGGADQRKTVVTSEKKKQNNARRRRQLGLSEESTQHTHKQNYCLRGAQVLLTATARKKSCKASIGAQRGLE